MEEDPDDPKDGPTCFICGATCSHYKNHVLSHYYRYTTFILFSPEYS